MQRYQKFWLIDFNKKNFFFVLLLKPLLASYLSQNKIQLSKKQTFSYLSKKYSSLTFPPTSLPERAHFYNIISYIVHYKLLENLGCLASTRHANCSNFFRNVHTMTGWINDMIITCYERILQKLAQTNDDKSDNFTSISDIFKMHKQHVRILLGIW